MKLSERYLQKNTDPYANFGYKDREGAYSEAGIEVEHAEVYGLIREIEGRLGYVNDQINDLENINKKNFEPILEMLIEDAKILEGSLSEIANKNKI